MSRPINLRVHIQRAVFGIRYHADGADKRFRYPFQPHGLPDAGHAGVTAIMGMIAFGLLAVRLAAMALIVLGANHQGIFAVTDKAGNFKSKGSIAAFMYSGTLPIDPRLASVIHRAKMKQQPFSRCFTGQGKFPPIPDRGHKISVSHTG